MAVDYFLKIDGIKGESVDSKHKDEIDIESFSWGVAATQGAAGPRGGRAGKASISDFSFAIRMSKASPQLLEACATGKHFPKAILTARKSGGSQLDFLKVTLEEVLISSYQTSGSGQTDTIEQIAVSFDTATFQYVPQKPDGSAGPPVTAFIKSK